MKRARSTKKTQLTEGEIRTVFRKIGPAERVFTPIAIPENGHDIKDRWIVTGGSSKPNKLVEISSWQTGQAY